MQNDVIGDRIKEALGIASPKKTILASASLALVAFFYVYSVGSFFKILVFPLQNRVTYYSIFQSYVISEYLDHIVIGSLLITWLLLSIKPSKAGFSIISAFSAFFILVAAMPQTLILEALSLASLPVIASLLVYNKIAKGKVLCGHSNLIKSYLGILGILVGSLSIIITILFIFFPSGILQVPHDYAYEIFLVLANLSPILVALSFSSFLLKFLIEFVRKIPKIERPANYHVRKQLDPKIKILFLSAAVLLSIALVIIPHQSQINPQGQLIGVDTGYYVTWISNLEKSQNLQEFLNNAFVIQAAGDRPLSLIFLFAIVELANNDIVNTLEYTPAIFGPALVLTIYFLTRQLTSDDRVSLFASFLTSISAQELIGIYAGFYANWMALILGYLSVLFLFRFLHNRQKRNILLFSFLIVILLFTHTYTWTILTIVIGVFLGVMLRLKHFPRKAVVIALLVLAFSITMDVAKITITNASGGIERDLQFAQERAGVDQFTKRWNNLEYTIHTFLGGGFSNFMIPILSLYWLFRMKMQESGNILLLIFLSVGFLPFLFGDYVVQSRVFYDIPFQIPAAIALGAIWNSNKGKIIAISCCLWILAISLRIASNFYLILPT